MRKAAGMQQRVVFSIGSIEQARAAADAAVAAGVERERVHFIARPAIEKQLIPDRLKLADSDFKPAAMRGLLIGAVIGLVVALIVQAVVGRFAVWSTVLGVLLGAAVVMFSASLMGAATEDPIRRGFQDRIDRGDILLVLDVEDALPGNVERALTDAGATRLPYEAPTAMT